VQSLSPQDWHARFSQQVRWTGSLQKYLFKRLGVTDTPSILEVGCGTGAFLTTLKTYTTATIYGLDKNSEFLSVASQVSPDSILTMGDAHDLPYRKNSFGITISHFLLLWVTDPIRVVKEMVRVTRPGGMVLALAEPDYGGRIDFPIELIELGRLQQSELQSDGANPLIGRELSMIFHRANLTDVESGVLGGQWNGKFDQRDWEIEWSILQNDLEGSIPTDEVNRLKAIDLQAWNNGDRILFVPTFYAWGRVPPE
jgi:SAM-dependent methyltransferase